jgi:hypothetical protein
MREAARIAQDEASEDRTSGSGSNIERNTSIDRSTGVRRQRMVDVSPILSYLAGQDEDDEESGGVSLENLELSSNGSR